MTRKRAAIVVATGLLAAGASTAQVQPNSEVATLTINGRSGSGFGEHVAQQLIPGAELRVVIEGEPLQPFVLAVGTGFEPGIPAGPFGTLNLFGAIALLNGFDPFGAGFFAITGSDGTFELAFDLPGSIPFGTSLAFQAAVQADAVGVPVLTAPETVRSDRVSLTWYSLGRIRGDNHYGTSPVDLTPSLHPDDDIREYRWSPDGTRLAYSASGTLPFFTDIYVVSAAGESPAGPTKITFNPQPSVYYDPVFEWSPAGTELAWILDPIVDNRFDLYVGQADGSGVVKVSPTLDGDVEDFVWTPDGQRLVYRASFEGELLDLAVVDRDGSNGMILSDPAAEVDVIDDYVLSPDGQFVAYRQTIAEDPAQVDLWVADLVTGERVAVSGEDNSWVSDFAWAPDGSRLGFRATKGPAPGISLWTVEPDGSGTFRVSGDLPEFGRVHSFAWSPDSVHLAYLASQVVAYEYNLYVNVAAPPLPNSYTQVSAPKPDFTVIDDYLWSPDGCLIAYTGDFLVEDRVDLFSVDPFGGGIVQLNWPLGDDYSHSVDGFGWSPRAERAQLAYHSNEIQAIEQNELYLVNADGSGHLLISGDNIISGNAEPGFTWSASGDWLSFRAFLDGPYTTDYLGTELIFLPASFFEGGFEPQWNPNE